MNKKYPHKKAVLVKGKRWYIKFGVFDEFTQKVKIKKYYKGLSEIKNEKKREVLALEYIKKINETLPFVAENMTSKEQAVNSIEKPSIIEAIDYIIKLKYSDFKDHRKTSHSFQSNARKFIEFLKEQGYSSLLIDKLRKDHVQYYIDYMASNEKLTGQTIENRISSLRAIFNHMIKRGITVENPFQGKLDKPKIIKSKKNRAYTDNEIAEIKEYTNKNDKGIWLICQFIYYTFMRPVEIGRLRVENILLNENKIYIPAAISKNNREDYISIPGPLKNILSEYLKHNPPNSYYLFTNKFTPGLNQVGYNLFGNRFKKVSKNLSLDKDCTLYSWKHTGVVNTYKSTKDIKSIQMQCRHSDIKQTDTYLKSLGFVTNESFMKGIPSI